MARKVYLIGVGLGNADTLTVRAQGLIRSAGLLIGAQRLLEQFDDAPANKLALVKSEEIVAALNETDVESACVLFSGDIGFFSGATRLREMLADIELESVPGISSLSYFCAKIGVPWQDVHHVSAHGRSCNIAGEVQTHERTFFLTGGKTKVADVCKALVRAGLGDCRVWAGEKLSYLDERILCQAACEMQNETFSDLSVMLVENRQPIAHPENVPSLPDSAFASGPDVPMTKEEVRAVVLSKLGVRADDVVWDIGAGTGSISVEAARAARRGCVYAVERKEDAFELLEANRERFHVTNMHIVPGTAPEALEGLPQPDCVFIGGSSGNLIAIIEAALAANPRVRLCVSAIMLETMTEALACVERLPFGDVKIVQLSVARSRDLAQRHMMIANNPIYLISATGAAEQGE